MLTATGLTGVDDVLLTFAEYDTEAIAEDLVPLTVITEVTVPQSEEMLFGLTAAAGIEDEDDFLMVTVWTLVSYCTVDADKDKLALPDVATLIAVLPVSV